MQRFVAELLTAEGALVEPIEPEGLEAVVPPSLQRALGVPELCRLGFRRDAAAKGPHGSGSNPTGWNAAAG